MAAVGIYRANASRNTQASGHMGRSSVALVRPVSRSSPMRCQLCQVKIHTHANHAHQTNNRYHKALHIFGSYTNIRRYNAKCC